MKAMNWKVLASVGTLTMLAAGCAAPGGTGDEGAVMGTATLALTGLPGSQCDLFYAEEVNGGPEIGPIPIPGGAADDGSFAFTFHLPEGSWAYTGYLDCLDADGAPAQYASFAGAEVDTSAEGWEIVFTFGEDAASNLGTVAIELCPSVRLFSVVPASPCAGESVFATYEVDAWLPDSPCVFDLTASLGDSSAAELGIAGPDGRMVTLEIVAPADGDYDLVTERVTASGNSKALASHAMTVADCGGDTAACTGTTILSGPVLTDDALLGGNAWDGDNDLNRGGTSEMQVGSMEWFNAWVTRSVLRFDLVDIPAGATITSADLRLFAHGECSSTGPEPDDCGTLDPGTWAITFHELRRDWVEAEVTWNAAAAGQPWAAGGAEDTALDRQAAATATLGGLNSLAEGAYLDVDLTASVQGFVDGTAPNHGWLLRPPSVPFYEGRLLQIRTADYASAGDPEAADKQPHLTVVWELPGCGG